MVCVHVQYMGIVNVHVQYMGMVHVYVHIEYMGMDNNRYGIHIQTHTHNMYIYIVCSFFKNSICRSPY